MQCCCLGFRRQTRERENCPHVYLGNYSFLITCSTLLGNDIISRSPPSRNAFSSAPRDTFSIRIKFLLRTCHFLPRFFSFLSAGGRRLLPIRPNLPLTDPSKLFLLLSKHLLPTAEGDGRGGEGAAGCCCIGQTKQNPAKALTPIPPTGEDISMQGVASITRARASVVSNSSS